jgi:hypothetical protein
MTNKILFGIPRGIAILAVLFMMAFSFDCFGSGQPPGKMLVCFLMSNIPAIILIFVVVFLWKNDLVLGIFFIGSALYLSIRYDGFGNNAGVLSIAAPFLLAGLLFFIHYFLKKKPT